ncbi:multidrug efflux MFS transporter MdtH [Chitinivorax sp. PXF-14]|uniref:multidrug efflux MFS transporter MdtH n=1 Tax=Chitinivorax sp. PXF-14 TaxID=3230488 RepID=UPI003466DCE3
MSSASKARRLGKYFILLDNLLVIFGFFVVFPLISIHFVDQLGWAASLVGAALALRQLSQQGLGLFGGALADHLGARPMIVTGMLLRAAGFFAMAAAHTPWLLFASCVLSGLGGSLFDPPRAALIAKLTRPRERSRFYSILMMQDSAGAVLAALLGSWLLRFDFRWVGWVGGTIFVVAALMNRLLLPPYRISTRRAPVFEGIRQVLADKPYRTLMLTFSGYHALVVQIMLMLPIAIKQMANDPRAVGWMYMLESALSLGLLYPLARFCDRRYTLQGRFMAGLALMTLSLAAMALAHHLATMFLLLASFYLGSILAEPARENLVANLADPARRGSYMGFGRIGLALGGAVGYLAGGSLYDLGQALHRPALPWLALGCIGAGTLYSLRRQFSAPHGLRHAAYAVAD